LEDSEGKIGMKKEDDLTAAVLPDRKGVIV
jgi:hypothetical protein